MSQWLTAMIEQAGRYRPEQARMTERLLSDDRPESRRVRRWIMQWCSDHGHRRVALGLDAVLIEGVYPSRADAITWDLCRELARDDRLSDWDRMPSRERERQAKRIVKAAKVLIGAIQQVGLDHRLVHRC